MTLKKFLLILSCIALVLVFTIVIPFLINLCYNCPVILIKTELEVADVLDYYGTLLGTGVAVVTFIYTAKATVAQISHQQIYQQKMKLWQEAEETVDLCLDTIHPMKMQYSFLETVSKNEPNRAYQLIGQIENYCLNTIVVTDRLSCSLNRASNDQLEDLIKNIEKVRNKMIPVANEYIEAFQDVVVSGIRSRTTSEERNLPVQRNQFGERIAVLDRQIKEIYDNDYLPLIKHKSNLFRAKYEEISQEEPGLLRSKKA